MLPEEPPASILREELQFIFHPCSIVVIGASNTPGKPGHTMMNNLIEYGFAGEIYAVNPNLSEVCGRPCYPSVLHVPGPVDLAIVLIPAAGVPKAMQELGSKGVRAALIYSAGFREAGEEGQLLEKQMLEIGRASGIRLVGPNCTGVVSTTSRVPWTRPSLQFPPCGGGVAFITQSGSMSGSFTSSVSSRGVRFSKVASVGNEADLTALDFLEYFGEDSETSLIAMFVEGVKDGRRLMQLSRRISKQKPIIAWKVGRTSGGARAVQSHTGTLSGNIDIYRAAFAQVGIIDATDFEEFTDLAVAFFHLPASMGSRVAIVTGPGAPGVTCADACEDAGLEVVQYSEATQQQLKLQLPHIRTTANPTNTEFSNFQDFETCVATVARDPGVDMIILAGPTEIRPKEFTSVALDIKKACPKPLVVTWLAGGKPVDEAAAELERQGLPVYRSPRRAAVALTALARYQRYKNRKR